MDDPIDRSATRELLVLLDYVRARALKALESTTASLGSKKGVRMKMQTYFAELKEALEEIHRWTG